MRIIAMMKTRTMMIRETAHLLPFLARAKAAGK